ncbi:MAG: hypothetical protein IPF42_18245 [Candidatus Microthrix sp.]|nr:hypothetical protein [Candidatus Microthrix sp.]
MIAIIDAAWNDDSARLMAVNVLNDGLLADAMTGDHRQELAPSSTATASHPDVVAPLGEPLAG